MCLTNLAAEELESLSKYELHDEESDTLSISQPLCFFILSILANRFHQLLKLMVQEIGYNLDRCRHQQVFIQ